MNSLSWFIYLADVLSNVGLFLFITGVIGVISAIFAYILIASHNIDNSDKKDHVSFKLPTRILIGSLVFIFFSGLIPEKNSMYMMAASEMGEKIYVHMNDVRDIVKLKLKEYKKELEK